MTDQEKLEQSVKRFDINSTYGAFKNAPEFYKSENENIEQAAKDFSLSMIKGTTLNNHYYDVQYDENGKTLWVHCSSGETVGRFDTIFGIDIHNTIEDQIENDKPQCLHCTHTKPTKEDFDFFCDYAKTNWNIEIDKSKIKI